MTILFQWCFNYIQDLFSRVPIIIPFNIYLYNSIDRPRLGIYLSVRTRHSQNPNWQRQIWRFRKIALICILRISIMYNILNHHSSIRDVVTGRIPKLHRFASRCSIAGTSGRNITLVSFIVENNYTHSMLFVSISNEASSLQRSKPENVCQ